MCLQFFALKSPKVLGIHQRSRSIQSAMQFNKEITKMLSFLFHKQFGEVFSILQMTF